MNVFVLVVELNTNLVHSLSNHNLVIFFLFLTEYCIIQYTQIYPYLRLRLAVISIIGLRKKESFMKLQILQEI